MSILQRLEPTASSASALPYSPGIRAGQIVQTAGQGGADPATGEYAAGIAAQTTRALQNVTAVLAAGQASLTDVVMVRAYLADAADFAAFNEAYAAFFAEQTPGAVLPARTTVVTGFVVPAMLVEIDALAVVG